MSRKIESAENIVVRFPGDLADALTEHSNQTLIPITALVRSLAEKYLDETQSLKLSYPKNRREKLEDKKGIHLFLTSELRSRLQDHADAYGTTLSQVLRSAVAYFLVTA